MPSMQMAYRVPPRAAQGSRAAKWINPRQDELLIPTREAAYTQIAGLEKQLKGSLTRHKRAELLIARAMIFEALGVPEMLGAAQDAYKATKTAITAHLMAVAHHHLGEMPEAVTYYEQAYRFPHEEGFNIDLAYTQALLFQGEWSKAHKMTLSLKKRMVYAAYLPEWDGKPCPELSVISEGGFGDIIHTGRWLPVLQSMGIKVTVYLPPYFFETGFVDLMRRQSWCPEIKLLTETPQNVPAVGFFDLPAIFNAQPDNLPPSVLFQADNLSPSGLLKQDIRDSRIANPEYAGLKNNGVPQVGFCWAARAMETPLCPSGVYRALTEQQADKIIASSFDHIRLVKLQKESDDLLAPMARPVIRNWVDTAALISNLDAVITVDTAIMHLAASMGKPTYVLLSGAVDWKFGMSGTTTPWYPTVRVIRNNAFGFDNTVREIIEKIQNGEFNHSTLQCSSTRKSSS